MRVEWYPEAEADLDEIVRYIFQDNPAAAFQLEDSLLNAARNLSATPEMGRVGRVLGTRELVVHPNFMLVYRIDDPIIYIAAVVHTRKQYPKN